MKSLKSSHVRGFTLIEVMVVLGMLALAAALSIAFGFDSIGRASAHGERDTVMTLLQTARARALANIDESAHGLHIATSTFILFTGSAYDSSDPENASFERTAAVSISGPTDIVFSPLAATSTNGTLTFTDAAGTATIEVNEEGRIEW